MTTEHSVTLPDGRTFTGPPWRMLDTAEARAIAVALGHRPGIWVEDPESALRAYTATCDCEAELTNKDIAGWDDSTALEEQCPMTDTEHTKPLITDEYAWANSI